MKDLSIWLHVILVLVVVRIVAKELVKEVARGAVLDPAKGIADNLRKEAARG